MISLALSQIPACNTASKSDPHATTSYKGAKPKLEFPTSIFPPQPQNINY